MRSNCCTYGLNASISEYVESILGPPYPTYRVLLTTVVVYSLILIFGVLGNACAIVSILRYSRKGCASNLYLLSLAVSDLTLLVFGLPLELRDAVTAYYPYSLPEFVCPIRAFLIEMSGSVSAFTITAFSIQRWLAICFPLKARSACRYRRTLKMLCGVWVIGAAGAIPVLAIVKINQLRAPTVDGNGVLTSPISGSADPIPGTEFCAADTDHPGLELAIIHYSFWISFVIPLIVIIVLYVHIAITIRRTCTMQSPVRRQHRELVLRKSAVKMLAAVATAFFVCWCPFHVQRLLSVYKFGEMVPWIEDMYSLLYFISGYFYYANAVVNPILYTMLSQRIRKGLVRSLRRRSFFINNNSGFLLHGMTEHDLYSMGNSLHAPTFSAIRQSMLSVVAVATNAGRNSISLLTATGTGTCQESTSGNRSPHVRHTTRGTALQKLESARCRRMVSDLL